MSAPSSPSGLSARTHRILEAPVLPLLLTLALPNIGEAAARITFLTADALFVSWLGSDALSAAAIVFPLFLILQTATASGIGSGVSSSVGRALGAGDAERARSLAGVAVAIALIGAALTTALMVLTGPRLYAAMGLASGALEMAALYSAVMFGGSGFVWTMNLLANVSRGAGNMMVPAFAIAIGELFHLALSPLLILDLHAAQAACLDDVLRVVGARHGARLLGVRRRADEERAPSVQVGAETMHHHQRAALALPKPGMMERALRRACDRGRGEGLRGRDRSGDLRPLDIARMGVQTYDITHYQPILFAAESWQQVHDVVGGFFDTATDEGVSSEAETTETIESSKTEATATVDGSEPPASGDEEGEIE